MHNRKLSESGLFGLFVLDETVGVLSVEEREMPVADQRSRDMILDQRTVAFIQDVSTGKGDVRVAVGPQSQSLSPQDHLVVLDREGKFVEVPSIEQAIKPWVTANQGFYVVLENPSAVGGQEHPKPGTTSQTVQLVFGNKKVIAGPCTFPLWPGQVATVVEGHELRSNQYLLVQVYDADAAMKNWPKELADAVKEGAPNVMTGQLFIIKGTQTSLFIPSTGIEVLKEEKGMFVRDAVTLERLEYCILIGEDGKKRFVRGPEVVFPSPTEHFLEQNGARKFKAIELNKISGIHIKVIAVYTDEDGKQHKAGEELFITGKDTPIYFPREEHAIVKYGDREIHFAVAVPEGEARYVLKRLTGEVKMVKGPTMLLPDPRTEVVIRRVLDLKTVRQLYPDNEEALHVNAKLLELSRSLRQDYVPDVDAMRALELARTSRREAEEVYGVGAKAMTRDVPRHEATGKGFAGDELTRGQRYTPPRTVVLDTKYDGAVTVGVWTNFAVLVVSKTGKRRIVVGPANVLLEYDETLEVLKLSTGTPKSDERLFETVYLRVKNNVVSDIIEAETKDLVKVRVKVSYRVDFEGDTEEERMRWFGVENYVKLLTDHIRSLVRNAVKQHGIEKFYDEAIGIVRDCVLGAAKEGIKQRPGRKFDENNMRVYEVEVLGVEIPDANIARLLVDNQQKAVSQALALRDSRRQLELAKETEAVNREKAEMSSATAIKELELQQAEATKRKDMLAAELTADQAEQERVKTQAAAELAIIKAKSDQELEQLSARAQIDAEALKAEVAAAKEKAAAFSPELIAALKAFGDAGLAASLFKNLSEIAVLKGESLATVASRLLIGLPGISDVLKQVLHVMPSDKEASEAAASKA